MAYVWASGAALESGNCPERPGAGKELDRAKPAGNAVFTVDVGKFDERVKPSKLGTLIKNQLDDKTCQRKGKTEDE